MTIKETILLILLGVIGFTMLITYIILPPTLLFNYLEKRGKSLSFLIFLLLVIIHIIITLTIIYLIL